MSRHDLSPAQISTLRRCISAEGIALHRDDLMITRGAYTINVYRLNDESSRYKWRGVGEYSETGEWKYLPKTAGRDKTKWERFVPTLKRIIAERGVNPPLFVDDN